MSARSRLLVFFVRPPGRIATLAAAAGEGHATLSNHVVIVGYGRVGSAVAEALKQQSVPFVVVEQNRDVVEANQTTGLPIFLGDAARPAVLRQAHIERARMLVLATPDPYQARAVIEQARAAKPTIDIVARTHSEAERTYLERHGVATALIGERELALGLARYALIRMGCAEETAGATIQSLRQH